MYLTFKFSIKDWYISENLDLLVSLHPLNTKLILIISSTNFNNVFILLVLSNNQCVSLSAAQLFTLDVLDRC
jgi:hypothetical protein